MGSAFGEINLAGLAKSNTPDERASAAHVLCRSLDREVLTAAEREAAQHIIRHLADDAMELVRRALSITLRQSELVPHDVAVKLAKDLHSIATPILSYSPVLSDDDLIDIVRTGGPARQVAIARRPELSRKVTGVMAEQAVAEAVEIIVANDNAQFDPSSLMRIIDRMGSSESIAAAISRRSSLPFEIVETLIARVSDTLKEQILSRHPIRAEVAAQIMQDTRERASVDLIDQLSAGGDPKSFASHLHRSHRLTPSLMLRALARGQMSFFEHAIAERAGVQHARTWLMIHDGGGLGFKAIYERAALPSRLFPAFNAGIEIYRALANEDSALDRDRFQERMLERFLTEAPTISREDLVYFLDILDRKSEQTAMAISADAAKAA